jgi:quinol monooxygenase YgiN
MTVANQITIEAVEGEEQALKNYLNDLCASALLEKGCQKFELYQYFEERTSFFIIEIWKSEKRYNLYLESSDHLEQMQRITPLVKSKTIHALKLTQCLTKLGLKEKEENN